MPYYVIISGCLNADKYYTMFIYKYENLNRQIFLLSKLSVIPNVVIPSSK